MTDDEFQDLPVEETFTLGNRKFRVCKEVNGCSRCFFNRHGIFCAELQELIMIPLCQNCFREDKKDVYFEEVEDEKTNNNKTK